MTFLGRLVSAIALLIASTPVLANSLDMGSSVAPPYETGSTQILLGKTSALAAITGEQSGQLATPARVFAPVAADKPNVFGSVALAAPSTPLDTYWRSVTAMGSDAGAAGNAYVAEIAALATLAKLDAVNRYVNGHVRYTRDGTADADRWSGAADTLARGTGDCEDYAIAKLQMLRRAGFAASDLYLVVLNDTARNTDHAVLVVRAEGRMLVLDNDTNRILDSTMLPNYRPIFSFSENRRWTHGYRKA